MARTPEAIALIFEDQQLTYSQLNTRANQLAQHLISLGVGPEVIVAVCLERSVELIVALLAVLKAGGAYLPLDPAWPQERQTLLLRQSGCASLIDPDGVQMLAHPAPARPAPAWPLAYINFTSGSTGIPKGVAIEHRSILRLVDPVNGFNLGAGARVLQLAPAAFDAATFEIWGPLLNGGTVVVASAGQMALSELASLLNRHEVSTLFLTTKLFHSMVDSELTALARVQQVLAGGEPLSSGHLRTLLRRFPQDHEFVVCYGPTENTTFTSCQSLRQDTCEQLHEGPLGRPIANTLVRVLDPSGQPCPIGIPGELHIGGDGLARGYLNNPELTAKTFIPDPFSNDPSARLYKSGDLASWNPDGTLAFHGRLDQQIKLRGFRIEPAEIEAQLLSHPAVAQAVVILRRDDPANPRLIAYWVAQQNATDSPSPEQLRSFLAQRLPDYMIPSAFVALQALPLTTNGKLDRKALPAPSFAGDLDQRVAPSTDLEQQLHAIWSEVLGHHDFGITDNFFAIGGHSLAAGRLVSRIEQSIGQALALMAVFQNPTIEALAPLLSDSSTLPAALTIPEAIPLLGDFPPGCLAFQASYAQARLWFLHQLQPQLTAYHIPTLWRLRGDLDVEALAQALADLITRHPTLRTSFQLHNNTLLQILHPPAAVHLEAEPLADRDPLPLLQDWLQQEAATPFDLAAGTLLRARLLQQDPSEHVLLINHHHIASDGWSLSILAADLTALYNARCTGQPHQLRPLSHHYQDYAAWQRQTLSGDRLQALNTYWIQQLSGLDPLELPTDHPRPATRSYTGDRFSFSIEPSLLEPFELVCRSEGATLQMGLLALLALLLHRYSRQDDFAIAIPIWGRNHPDLEPLIGFFINTLPIRVHCSQHLSFRQLLSQVAATSVAAYDHQDLPFEQIVEALQPQRDTSRNPLAQVMLQLMEIPDQHLDALHGLDVESLDTNDHAARFDLEVFCRRNRNAGLTVDLAYATDLFCADRIERLATHLLTLLASAIKAPDTPAASLNLLPEPERQRIASWQHGPTINTPDLCVHQLFEQQVERTPEAIALIFEDQQLTYSQLNTRANQLAQHLISLGVGPEVIVAVCLERSVELIVALLAILKAGGAYLPLDPSWPSERQQLLRQQAACNLLIDPEGPVVLGPLTPAHAPVSASCLAYVTYTSGSTGQPKGVAVTHRSILRLVDPIQPFHLAAGAVVLQLAPVAFDAATFEIWGPLLNGGLLLIAPPHQPSLQDLADWIQRHRITTLWLSAGLFEAMVDSQSQTLANVQHILTGGDVVSPRAAQSLLTLMPEDHTLINGYGPSENTTFTCCQVFKGGEVLKPGDLPIGRPIANTALHILDPAGLPCPIGIPGELHIGGDGLARGYLNNPQLTAQSFIADPFSTDPSSRLYKSGDLVSWNPDGSLAFHGRLDQQIKLRGFRIEPAEIEAQLLSHPAVAQAVVILRRDDPANPRLVAYWVAQPDDPAHPSLNTEQLRSFLAQRLPDHMVPAAFLSLQSLPLTANGKLDRQALPAASFSADPSQRVEPTTPLEQQLYSIWADILGHSDFGIHDNFFTVGGHSLSAARLAAAMQHIHADSASLSGIFRNPTIAELARIHTKPNEEQGACIITLQPHGDRAPLFAIHGMGGTVWGFVELARHLTPDRPIFGIQAVHQDQTHRSKNNVREMASTYAEAILKDYRRQPIHLVGYSAGGWYAHAVAEAVISRGGSIASLIILDSHPTARIHRRIGTPLLILSLLERLPIHLQWLLKPSTNETYKTYAKQRLRSFMVLTQKALGWQPKSTAPSPRKRPNKGIQHAADDNTVPHTTESRKPDFVRLLATSHRPSRLPIGAYLLTPETERRQLELLWGFYCRGGVETQTIFNNHKDFLNPGLMPELAHVLENTMQKAERTATASTT